MDITIPQIIRYIRKWRPFDRIKILLRCFVFDHPGYTNDYNGVFSPKHCPLCGGEIEDYDHYYREINKHA